MPSRRFEWIRQSPVLLAFCREALLRLLGRWAGGIFLDEGAQRLARGGALPQLTLGARDVEQRIGRLGILGPELDHFLLGRDGGLVVAHRVVRVAYPVLRRGQELAAREIGHEILEAGDGELIVAELELVERQLVRLFFGGGAALALAQLVLQLRLRLLELSQAVVQVDIEVLLAPLGALGLVREHLEPDRGPRAAAEGPLRRPRQPPEKARADAIAASGQAEPARAQRRRRKTGA